MERRSLLPTIRAVLRSPSMLAELSFFKRGERGGCCWSREGGERRGYRERSGWVGLAVSSA